MSRRATLRSSRDFRAVYRGGARARRDGVTVWALRSEPAAPTRLGLAVRSGAMTAVTRNRVRRRIRAIVDAYEPAPGYDIVVAAETAELAGRTFQQTEADVTASLAAAGVGRR